MATDSTETSTTNRARRCARLVLAVAAAVLIAACGGLGGSEERLRQAPQPPNILLIVTDDQPVGMTKRMPKLTNATGFARFAAYYDNNPLCCPSRATLLTGLYSHHTGIETNLLAEQFDDSATLATWLDTAGYETGLFGKYLNEYPWRKGSTYVPPGWDVWSAFTPDAAYYDYTLVGEDSRRKYGSRPKDYSTDVLADQVNEFIEGAGGPYFAYFAPYAPHAPRTSAPRHRHAFANTKVRLPKNFNRVAEDGPAYWRKRPKVDPAAAREATKGQWRSLRAVDDAIARFLATIKKRDEAEDTVVIFLSDNGYSLGSHRNPWKDCAYDECIHLPLMVRWPGVTSGNGDQIGALVGSIDIAPTIAEIAGATPTILPDGQSLVPIIKGDATTLNRPVLLRHVRYPRVGPTFWGVRTERWTYVIYEKSDERELYDNDADPHQLDNLAGSRATAPIEEELEAKIDELRDG